VARDAGGPPGEGAAGGADPTPAAPPTGAVPEPTDELAALDPQVGVDPDRPMRFTLRDGSPVLVRPILPDDKDRLVDAFARLSETSRYHRFGTAVRRLTDEQLRYLTEIDYDDHMAWVALDPVAVGRPGLGVARYVRLPAEPEIAEAAVTVVDSRQGLGLGTLLLGVLGLSALAHGIRSFRAYVLEENQAVQDLFAGLGATMHHEGPMLRVDVPLPDDPRKLPDTPTGRIFRAVAARLLPPLDARYPGIGLP
jgi:RimJ/RimL family protein N-acetyltransferase